MRCSGGPAFYVLRATCGSRIRRWAADQRVARWCGAQRKPRRQHATRSAAVRWRSVLEPNLRPPRTSTQARSALLNRRSQVRILPGALALRASVAPKSAANRHVLAQFGSADERRCRPLETAPGRHVLAHDWPMRADSAQAAKRAARDVLLPGESESAAPTAPRLSPCMWKATGAPSRRVRPGEKWTSVGGSWPGRGGAGITRPAIAASVRVRQRSN
jgi:hypothetical protein